MRQWLAEKSDVGFYWALAFVVFAVKDFSLPNVFVKQCSVLFEPAPRTGGAEIRPVCLNDLIWSEASLRLKVVDVLGQVVLDEAFVE